MEFRLNPDLAGIFCPRDLEFFNRIGRKRIFNKVKKNAGQRRRIFGGFSGELCGDSTVQDWSKRRKSCGTGGAAILLRQ
jgi:hypothetical protein